MKKVALTLAAIAAATVFAPEASAVPVFARQTGMACSACHYQHFPLLNGFGRAFKNSGFTMMGAQGKVEGEHLDMPDRVNMGMFMTTYVQNESGQGVGSGGATAPAVIGTPGTGGEFSLFMGGRAAEFLGFIAEAGLGGAGASNGTAPANFVQTGGIVGATKMLMLFPVGDARIGLSVHSSNGQGVAYSFETLNTGAANTHKMMGNSGPSNQHVQAAYASQYLGTNTAATGASIVANNSMGFVNVGLWEMAGNALVNGANSLNLNYERVAGTFDFAGFDLGVGIQHFGGVSTVTNSSAVNALNNNTNLTPGLLNAPNATILDAQAQGDFAGMPVGLYVTYGRAAPSTGTDFNAFNLNSVAAGGTDKTSFNVAAEIGLIPHVATVQVAVRMAKNGMAPLAGVDQSGDNALMVGVTYELAQNIGLSLTGTQQSGSYWDQNPTAVGKTATTLLLETLF